MAGPVSVIERPAWPVRVSDNWRYFVDLQGRPVFWLGTTRWQLVPDQSIFATPDGWENALLIVEPSRI